MAAEIFFSEAADAALSALDADPTQPKLLGRIGDALAALEADPGDRPVRRRQYRPEIFGAPLWGIPVRGDDEDWLVLWGEHPETPGAVIVHYLGPDL